jgi:hypothetical protein
MAITKLNALLLVTQNILCFAFHSQQATLMLREE